MSTLELREASDGSLTLTGYASRTEKPYDMGSYMETIRRGAFKRTLSENPDVTLLVNHEGLPLARTTSGNLKLSENTLGLRVEASLDPEDPDVKTVAGKMRRGDLSEMSFAFLAREQTWNEDYTERSITDVGIHRGDVSLVTMAANPAATADLRSALTLEQRKRRAETIGKRIAGVTRGPAMHNERTSRVQVQVAPSYASIARAKHARLMSDTTRRGRRS